MLSMEYPLCQTMVLSLQKKVDFSYPSMKLDLGVSHDQAILNNLPMLS